MVSHHFPKYRCVTYSAIVTTTNEIEKQKRADDITMAHYTAQLERFGELTSSLCNNKS
jgi:hypothetical protein